MNWKFLFACFLIGSWMPANAQTLKKFWVEFADKKDNPYLISQPETFLSPRAIERRKKHGVEVTEADLPVNPQYLHAIRQAGAAIHNTSRWLNGASIIATDSIAGVVKNLAFVRHVRYAGRHMETRLRLRRTGKKRDSIDLPLKLESPYGYAESQIKQVNGDVLHFRGGRGAGMLVAVLDGGFSNVDIMPFFDSLFANERLLATKDFVDGDDYVFESSGHGSQVLSVMAANLPGIMVGTAPDAGYICLKTEDTSSEFLVEECNWVAALEYADSLGADVVNSSVGYTEFSDSTMNYRHDILDGKTALASRAANMAFERGMIVVTSVGNEGNNAWKYLDVPADAIGALAIGAVDMDGRRARFSSLGPSADGRIKPDLAAAGKGVSVASVYSPKVSRSSGTSFSSPLIAGMVAALWSAFPEKTNREIVDAILRSASQYLMPDNELGYGIPDFDKAWKILNEQDN
ncbi:MAG: peptidase S8 [Bacteroidetes bacterium]|nr:MAG: peptidase S8 [Bacteroidota bacterium]